MPSNMGSQLVANFANLTHEGLLGYLLIPIKPSPSILFKFLSCTEKSYLLGYPNQQLKSVCLASAMRRRD